MQGPGTWPHVVTLRPACGSAQYDGRSSVTAVSQGSTPVSLWQLLPGFTLLQRQAARTPTALFRLTLHSQQVSSKAQLEVSLIRPINRFLYLTTIDLKVRCLHHSLYSVHLWLCVAASEKFRCLLNLVLRFTALGSI
jgi:hypothetical protein